MTSERVLARTLWAGYLALHRQTNNCFAKDRVTINPFMLLAALADQLTAEVHS